jgi:hypothetical protein
VQKVDVLVVSIQLVVGLAHNIIYLGQAYYFHISLCGSYLQRIVVHLLPPKVLERRLISFQNAYGHFSPA